MIPIQPNLPQDPNTLRENVRIMHEVWDDMRAPASALKIPAGLNPPTWDDTFIGWLFEGTGVATPDEAIFAIFHLPHTYREGTSVVPHVHWQATSNLLGNVYWQLEYVWLNTGDVQGPAGGLTTIFITPAVSGAVLTMQYSEFAPLVKVNATVSSTIACILTRMSTDIGDSYADNALLKEFDMHFQKDALGSVGQVRKWS